MKWIQMFFQYVQMNKEGKDYTIYLKGNNIDAIYVKDFFDKVVNPLQDLQRKWLQNLRKRLSLNVNLTTPQSIIPFIVSLFEIGWLII